MNTEKEQLHKFINEFADGGAISHMADLGMSVSEISAKLDFPLSNTAIALKVWTHYLETGKILLSKPQKGQEFIEQVTYEKISGKYGRSSMQQIRTRIPICGKEYVECDFGIHIKRDYEGFVQSIAGLNKADREYVLSLPWPRARVYHELDDRMRRIMNIMEQKNEHQSR